MALKIIHFADAHIDMIVGGKKDPQTGLPVRAGDFLNALDQIIDCAVSEKADLVLFAGDAYRDAVPVPTYQREWGRRLMRLSEAKIPLLMIPGNHDISPAGRRASALQDADTYKVPYLHLAKTIQLWKPEDLNGVPVQVLTIPWLSKSAMTAQIDFRGKTNEEINELFQEEISKRVQNSMDQIDPNLPAILLAHYSVLGAQYPNRHLVTLGGEVTLSRNIVTNPIFSYCALGHIHKFQDLNEGHQPPAVYSGSIEKIDFGETDDSKGFVSANIDIHQTTYSFRKLEGRPFYNIELTIQNSETFQDEIYAALPDPEKMRNAMIRLSVEYPDEWAGSLDERELRKRTAEALEFHLIRKPISNSRIRIDAGAGVSSMSRQQLLDKYFDSISISGQEKRSLLLLADEVFNADEKSES